MEHERSPESGQPEGQQNTPKSAQSVGGEGDASKPSRWAMNSGSSGSAAAGAGLQFVVSILLFLFVGQWLDKRFGTGPWGTLAGVMVGAVAGFASLYRRLMGELEREEAQKRR